MSSWDHRFQLIDTIALGSQDSVPVIRLSGVSWYPDGRILIVDVSEANAKLYQPEGQLIAVIGRKGRGPGEFEQPRHPIVKTDELVIGEASGLVSFFSTAGDFRRRIHLRPSLGISSLSTSRAGGFLATTWPAELGLLVAYDSNGAMLHRYLPRSSPPVRSRPTDFLWRGVTQYWQAVFGDTVVVMSTLSDSLWVLTGNDSTVSAARLVVEGWTEPQLPPVPPDPASRSPFEWATRFHTTVGLVGDGQGVLGVSFVKGILHYGDPAVFVIRTRDGRWYGATDGPPVVAVKGDEVLAIHRPGAALAVLARYKVVRQ